MRKQEDKLNCHTDVCCSDPHPQRYIHLIHTSGHFIASNVTVPYKFNKSIIIPLLFHYDFFLLNLSLRVNSR